MFIDLLAPSRQNLMPNVAIFIRKPRRIKHGPGPSGCKLDEVKVEINIKEVQKAFTKTLTKKKRVRLCFATRL